jgi:protocatechuate 3,4-dioxygenase beta subunit
MRAVVFAAARAAAQTAPSAPQRGGWMANAIEGRVTTPDGRPVAGAAVTLVERELRHNQPIHHIADARAHVVTDADGRYRLEDARLDEF